MEQYGNVNLGMSILEGKQRPDPTNQELNLGRQPKYGRGEDVEPRKQNVYMGNQEPKLYYDSIHESIKNEMANGKSKREAVKIAREQAKMREHGDIGTITPQDVYRRKYSGQQNQACTLVQYQEQKMPYI